MKPADRKLALKVARFKRRNLNNGLLEITRRYKLHSDKAQQVLYTGELIRQAEACRLTAPEMLVMKTLARVEARRVELGEHAISISRVDYAAGKRSGWTAGVVKKRLRKLRLDEANLTGNDRMDLLVHSSRGFIWLTPAGWAFVWATGLILKNWKVPA